MPCADGRRSGRVALVAAWRHPGRHALSVLAGALGPEEDEGLVRVTFARDREEVLQAAAAAQAAGLVPLLAWSFYSASFPGAAEDRAWVAERLGAPALSLAGGVHATAEPRQTLEAGFDLVAVGEGERVVRDVVRRLAAGEDPRGAAGLAWLEGGSVRSAPRPPPIALEDFPPFAARHGRFGPIEITRGCLYACRFCQTPFLSKARFRHRPVEDVARWVRALRDAGKRDVRFITPTALSYGTDDETPNLGALESLLLACREAAGPEGRLFLGTFPSEVRPEHVTPEAVALLARHVANDNLILGGQSGSDRQLAASGRGHDAACILRAARIARDGGFRPNVDFILGMPGETEQDLRDTLAVMEELASLGARVHAHVFMPLPGTPWRDEPPGRVDEATRVAIERLASRGAAYGQWQGQVGVARGIAARRQPRQRSAG